MTREENCVHDQSFPRLKKPEVETFYLREWGKPQARLHRPKLEGRRGRRENSVSHGRLHEKEECKRGSSPRKPESFPASTHDGFTACFARPPVDGPSYPPLADLLGFAVLALARFPAQNRQGRPCDERNGSPEPRDFSRREHGCVTPEACGHRSRSAHRTRRATRPFWIETRRNIVLDWGGSMAGEGKYCLILRSEP